MCVFQFFTLSLLHPQVLTFTVSFVVCFLSLDYYSEAQGPCFYFFYLFQSGKTNGTAGACSSRPYCLTEMKIAVRVHVQLLNDEHL